jgi:hypothetical protein
MKREQFWILAVPIFVVLLTACSGSTSSLVGDSSSASGRFSSVTLRFSDELRGLPTPLPADWKPFSSDNLQVTINHPVGWAVKEQRNSIAFTSPDGIITQLTLIGRGDLSSRGLIYDNDLPDTRCSTDTNAHGVTVRMCLDKLAESRNASFVLKSSDGQANVFSLLTGNRGSLQVFGLDKAARFVKLTTGRLYRDG